MQCIRRLAAQMGLCPDACRRALVVHFSEYSGRVEEIYLPEDGLGAHTSIADTEWAEQEARKADFQPELVLWTNGLRDENGAVGYAVAWRKGGSWAGRKTHMGSTRRLTMRSAPPSRVLSRLRRSGPSDGDSAGCGASRTLRHRSPA